MSSINNIFEKNPSAEKFNKEGKIKVKKMICMVQ